MRLGTKLAENRSVTNLYIARHGQTTWNVEHRIQGMLDSPLTELGVLQASWLRECLSGVNLDVVYSSTSLRAMKTAEIVCQGRKCPLVTYDDFREISLGEWEGMKRAEIDKLYPGIQQLYWNDPMKFYPVGQGETFIEVKKRVFNLLHKVLEENQGKNILLVTHTAIVKIIMAHYDGRSMERLWDPPRILPASLCHIVINGDRNIIEKYGDTSHYKKNT